MASDNPGGRDVESETIAIGSQDLPGGRLAPQCERHTVRLQSEGAGHYVKPLGDPYPTDSCETPELIGTWLGRGQENRIP